MPAEPLVAAAERIADGDSVDWQSMTSALSSDEDRAIADELVLVGRIADGHRQLHQLLPLSHDVAGEPVLDRSRWGHLDVLDVVGRGSYGTVYRAWDTRLERVVALKLFHRAPDPDAVMREGRMLARVRHENVVTVHGADVIDGVAGIWMEFVHGRTLDQLVKEHGPMSARDAAAIGVDVARALAAIHEAQLLHCDLKGQNVVREENGRVVLMDMGAGRAMPEASDEAHLSDVAGTPRYMAPELFASGARTTTATDVYSLGVLLYFLVTGRFPVDGKSLGELRQAHTAGRVRPLDTARPGLPPAYLALVAGALSPSAALRPQSAEDVRAALAPLVGSSVARPPRLWLWAAAAIALGATALGLWVLLATPTTRSIAVLPIKNLTGDPSKGYVADGLTEVLISNIARVESLRVPSFAAVASFRDSTDPPSQIAKRLGAQLLLAGSITQVDSRFRMTVTLIDSQAGTAIWGDEITREAPGIVAAQAEIARMVAERLVLGISQDAGRMEKQAAIDPRAQDAYLRGLALQVTPPYGQEEAARHFRKAVEVAPGFADAWARLSLAETFLIEQSGATRTERAAGARTLAEHAIGLDPTLASGHVALGTVLFYYEWDFEGAERAFLQALRTDPSNAFAHQRYSFLLAALGRLDEALELAEHSVLLEPLVANRHTSLGIHYYYARQYEKAAAAMEQGLAVTPDYPVAYNGLSRIASAQGQTAEALAQIDRALAGGRYPGYVVERARVLASAGRRDEAKEVLAELAERQKAGESYSRDNLAYIAAAEGRIDDAFAILEEAARSHLTNMLWIAVDPRVDPLRRDPRFGRLLRAMGLQR